MVLGRASSGGAVGISIWHLHKGGRMDGMMLGEERDVSALSFPVFGICSSVSPE